MRTVSYCTALYHQQGYCQAERVECFNKAQADAEKHDLEINIQLYINNSPPEFVNEMLDLYQQKAQFKYLIKDLGEMRYETHYDKHMFGVEWKRRDDDGRLVDTKPDDRLLFSVSHFDIFRLLAEIFNKGMDYSTKCNDDFFGILSGDQLLPEQHPATLVRFLDEHPNAGIVSSLAFFDDSKKEIVADGDVKTYLVPLIIFHPRDGETKEQADARRDWVYAHLLPHAENNWMGMEYCEVDAVGTGGAIIPRDVFTRLRFNENTFEGEGEDIQYCYDIQKMGRKVFVIPTLIIENRYPDGTRY